MCSTSPIVLPSCAVQCHCSDSMSMLPMGLATAQSLATWSQSGSYLTRTRSTQLLCNCQQHQNTIGSYYNNWLSHSTATACKYRSQSKVIKKDSLFSYSCGGCPDAADFLHAASENVTLLPPLAALLLNASASSIIAFATSPTGMPDSTGAAICKWHANSKQRYGVDTCGHKQTVGTCCNTAAA